MLVARISAGLGAFIVMFALALPGQAADRARIEAYLEVTGFDVSLESIALSAKSAPAMLGLEEGDFGDLWQRRAEKVFDPGLMHEMGAGMLEATLTDDLLTHAADFYAGDLGQRLVAVENASHMDESEGRDEKGRKLLETWAEDNPERVKILQQMNQAIDSSGHAARALQEVQIRFLMAASTAGVLERPLDEEALRAMMRANEADLRASMEIGALENAAYVYRDFSNADMATYLEALQTPEMQEVYTLMNAVQYEIMANRFEALAVELRGLRQGEDI